ncbi:hypothetical protein EDF78_102696 [Rahnella sp. BIGb0236]|jgi:magnesium-transporting ATPase (P-type)|nr:hypothetical protein EDF78_102696 [Rahnella sp. BIGb0236]
MILFIYVFLTFLSLFPLYFIASHLFYSDKLYMNLLAFVIMGCCTASHYSFLRTDVIPLLNIKMEMGEGWFVIILRFVCIYSYGIPIYLAKKRYY